MPGRLGFHFQQLIYDLRVSLLARPAILTVFIAVLAPTLTSLEAHQPVITTALSRTFPWVCGPDVAAAQLVLTTIAGSMMTVLSLTYSVLLMALTLASMQFSPRILFGFLRDPTSQTTLGLFVGTFLYCLLLLRMVHGAPEPFIPQLGMIGALLLALLSLGWLLYFIHHIATNIQANHLVARIGADTAEIAATVFGEPFGDGELAEASAPEPRPEDAHDVAALQSGYVQLIDEESLVELARAHRVTIFLRRGPGEFVTAGTPLVSIVPAARATAALGTSCCEAYDLGEMRTMQQDVEYGVRQMVDIALKAISPAVNDPSTAVTCIDHLSVLLAWCARRREPRAEIREGDELRVQLRPSSFRRMLDLSFNQIRQYGRADMAVVLRLLRSLEAIAHSTRYRPYLRAIERQSHLLEESSRNVFLAGDCEELGERRERLAALLRSRLG